MDREEIQARLTGPCPTLRPSFNQDSSIDYDGVRDIVDFLIDSGRQNIMLTAGDTLFDVLSDQEIGELMKVVVEHTAAVPWLSARTGAGEQVRVWSLPNMPKRSGQMSSWCVRPIGQNRAHPGHLPITTGAAPNIYQ